MSYTMEVIHDSIFGSRLITVKNGPLGLFANANNLGKNFQATSNKNKKNVTMHKRRTMFK